MSSFLLPKGLGAFAPTLAETTLNSKDAEMVAAHLRKLSDAELSLANTDPDGLVDRFPFTKYAELSRAIGQFVKDEQQRRRDIETRRPAHRANQIATASLAVSAVALIFSIAVAVYTALPHAP